MALTQSRHREVRAAPVQSVPLFVFLTLLAVGIFFVTTWPLNSRSGYVQLGQYAIIGYTSWRAAACLRGAAPRYASLVLWLFTYTLFGLVQTVQLSEHRNPFRVAAPDHYVEIQIAIIIVGCIAFDMISTWQARRPTREPGDLRQLSLRRTVIFSLVTLALTPTLFSLFGGWSALFGSREAVSSYLADTAGGKVSAAQVMIRGFANVAPFVCAFSLIRLRLAGVFTFGKRFELAVLLAALVGVNLVFNNPISQPRFWIATVAIAIALSGRWIMSKGFQYCFVAGFLIATLLLFPFLNVFRYSDRAGLPQQENIVAIYLAQTDYGSAQDITNTVDYVADRGHTDGRQLTGVVLFWVPRSVWTDKPTDTAQVLAQHIGFANLNIDSPMWAEGYIDFGFPGAIGIMGLFGLLTGWADRLLIRRNLGAAMATVLVPLFIGYELILLRGSLLQAMGRLTVFVVMCLLISKRRHQRQRWVLPSASQAARARFSEPSQPPRSAP